MIFGKKVYACGGIGKHLGGCSCPDNKSKSGRGAGGRPAAMPSEACPACRVSVEAYSAGEVANFAGATTVTYSFQCPDDDETHWTSKRTYY